MPLQVHGTMLDSSFRWVLAQVVIVMPILAGPDGPRNEPAAAIGAHVAEKLVHADATEGALKRADTRVLGFRWKRRSTVLADRSKLEHFRSSIQAFT